MSGSERVLKFLSVIMGDVDFQGDARAYLRLELLQLMLRHQLEAAQELWKIPAQLEVISIPVPIYV